MKIDLAGVYSVTIVDSNGCEMEQEFEVGTMTSSANLRVHELTISSTLISTQEGTWLSSESKNKKYIDLIILKSDGSIVKKESISFHQKHLISLPSISGQYFIQTFDRNNYSRITFKVQVIQ